MKKLLFVTLMLGVVSSMQGQSLSGDHFDTGKGSLTIYPVLHGTLALINSLQTVRSTQFEADVELNSVVG